MKRMLIVAVVIFAGVACIGKSKGWSQGDRDKLIGSCVEETKKASPTIDESKLKNYCSCYQQVLEKKHATLSALAAVGEADLMKSAEECLSMIQ